MTSNAKKSDTDNLDKLEKALEISKLLQKIEQNKISSSSFEERHEFRICKKSFSFSNQKYRVEYWLIITNSNMSATIEFYKDGEKASVLEIEHEIMRRRCVEKYMPKQSHQSYEQLLKKLF